ncbi:hypothetical protein ACWDG1_44485 [Streptomyces sp. NPDC001177]
MTAPVRAGRDRTLSSPNTDATTTTPLHLEDPDEQYPQHDVDPVLAYPEPPAHPNWRRRGTAKSLPLTADEQKRNRELLDLALRERAE